MKIEWNQNGFVWRVLVGWCGAKELLTGLVNTGTVSPLVSLCHIVLGLAIVLPLLPWDEVEPR